MAFRIERDPSLSKLVTFVPNKKLPVYNWFYYKEGFSRDLVFRYFRKWNVGKGLSLIDPFAGSGTSLLAAKEHGIESVGMDVHPVALLASRVKTRNWDAGRLLETLSLLRWEGFEKPPAKDIREFPFRRFFPKHAIEDLVFLRKRIMELEMPFREFFLLALATSAYRCSWMYKDGAVLKAVKKPVPPLRKYFFRLAKRMAKESEKVRGPEPVVMEWDAREMKRIHGIEGKFNISITSPPYLNKIEYQKIYSVEEWIIGRKGKGFIRSGLPAEDVVGNYFSDVRKVLDGIHHALAPGGRIAWVVAGGVLPGKVVEADIITAEIAEEAGFRVERIVEARKRVATMRRTIKIGEARESVIEMVKD